MLRRAVVSKAVRRTRTILPISVTLVAAVAFLAGGCGSQSRHRVGPPHSTLTIYMTAPQAGP